MRDACGSQPTARRNAQVSAVLPRSCESAGPVEASAEAARRGRLSIVKPWAIAAAPPLVRVRDPLPGEYPHGPRLGWTKIRGICGMVFPSEVNESRSGVLTGDALLTPVLTTTLDRTGRIWTRASHSVILTRR